jgi:hypothetical protein
MNPDISVIFDGAAAAFSDPMPRQAGGHDPHYTGFNLQQLELSVNSAVDPFFHFNSNLVFGPDGFELEEAYGTTTALPYNLQARVGQFLTRFGRINATHPHGWDFVDQPFIASKFLGGDGNRGLGAEVSWLTPLPWYGELVGSVTEARGESTARSFMADADPFYERTPADLEAVAAFQQFFPLSRDWALNWGLSAASGPNPAGRAELVGTDLYVKYRPLQEGAPTVVGWTTELMARHRSDATAAGGLVDYGGYSALTWKFAQQWGTGARYEYGSGVPGDPLDPDWVSARHRGSLDLTFWPTEFSRWRAQASVDVSTWRPQPAYAAFLSYEFVTGAHGAHKF